MWNNTDPHRSVILPPRKGFLTPSPATRNSKPSFTPMSETKRSSPATTERDLFHVIHKVPAGDSPYVRAKHIQLIEKDPSRAISLFWSAINAGDRVDSALKDMAIVMKQLNRSDEAIEAVKSFRHLCPVDSQESLDNVLVELYKRAGRVEEEIEMLQRKLKRIEEGTAFGGRRTKTARSQGKKVHITVDEEKSRILGNLAWACLQQNNYSAAEGYYRRALVLEPDKNKQCNLAICLMNMNRLSEAKALLRTVKLSCGTTPMDESFAKSFERAWEMLTELDPKSALEPPPSTNDGDWRRNIPTSLPSPAAPPRSREFYCGNTFENMAKSRDDISALEGMSLKCLQQQQPVTVDQLKRRRAGTSGMITEPETARGSWRSRGQSSPAPFTQPRRRLWGFSGDGDQRTTEKSFSSEDDDWRRNIDRKTPSSEEKFPSTTETPNSTIDSSSVCNKKKSWADMAEEEENEEELSEFYKRFDLYESPFPPLQTQMKYGDDHRRFELGTEEKEYYSNDENADCNILRTQMRNVGDEWSENQPVRRSLFLDRVKGKSVIRPMRRNRLKVFQDITQSP